MPPNNTSLKNLFVFHFFSTDEQRERNRNRERERRQNLRHEEHEARRFTGNINLSCLVVANKKKIFIFLSLDTVEYKAFSQKKKKKKLGDSASNK